MSSPSISPPKPRSFLFRDIPTRYVERGFALAVAAALSAIVICFLVFPRPREIRPTTEFNFYFTKKYPWESLLKGETMVIGLTGTDDRWGPFGATKITFEPKTPGIKACLLEHFTLMKGIDDEFTKRFQKGQLPQSDVSRLEDISKDTVWTLDFSKSDRSAPFWDPTLLVYGPEGAIVKVRVSYGRD